MNFKSRFEFVVKMFNLRHPGTQDAEHLTESEIVNRVARRNPAMMGYSLETFQLHFQHTFITCDELELGLACFGPVGPPRPFHDRKRRDGDGTLFYIPLTPQEELAFMVLSIGEYIEELRRSDRSYHGQIEVFDLWDPRDQFNDEARSMHRLFNEEEG
jgi:hypothetical protein